MEETAKTSMVSGISSHSQDIAKNKVEAKVILTDPKKRKIGSTNSDYIFLGYSEHSATYRFLVLNSDIIECNTIIETKNVEFFEHVFSPKG